MTADTRVHVGDTSLLACPHCQEPIPHAFFEEQGRTWDVRKGTLTFICPTCDRPQSLAGVTISWPTGRVH